LEYAYYKVIIAHMLKIRVPATSANLGPGFDCLGLALDIWNEVSFEACDKMIFNVTGEGVDKLNNHPKNMLTKSFTKVFEICGRTFKGVKINSHNDIMLSSGLGSSAAAIVAGLFGANEMLGKPLDENALLKLAAQIEGHPDNVAAALLGGLVVSALNTEEIITRRYEIPPLTAVIVKPNVHWPTHVARSVLPKSITRSDATFNIGRTALVVDAFRTGDLELLNQVMDDRLHQPYRLGHIRGGTEAYQAARKLGAAALSGAGPSLIAFVPSNIKEAVREAMLGAFEQVGVEARSFVTRPSNLGAHII
jgi:homoserine kinase